MASKRFPYSWMAPRRGMNVRDKAFPSDEQCRLIANMRISKYGKGQRRPGYRQLGSAFTGQKFYGLKTYIDAGNNERVLTLNNASIIEFNENQQDTRVSGLTDGKYGNFVNALGACFFHNGAENKKGLGDTWVNWGVLGPQDEPIVDVSSTGGTLAAGAYIVRYSYVVKSAGARLIISSHNFPVTVTTTGSTSKITVKVKKSSDPQVTHIIVWVTAVNGSALYLSSEVTNATQDVEITASPSTEGLVYSDYDDHNGLPGNPVWATYHDKRLWVIPENDPTNVYGSLRGTHYDLGYFPTSNLVNMSKSGLPLVFCFGLLGNLYAMTKQETYILKDSDMNSVPEPVSDRIGTENPYSWASWGGGIIGKTNRGIEYFDGYKFSKMSDDIYQLLQSDLNETTGQGFIIQDSEYGEMYQYGVRLDSDVENVLNDIPGFTAGSISSGLGAPSDDFSDSTVSSTRWTNNETSNTQIQEAGNLLEFENGGTDEAGDVNVESKYTLGQPINASVDITIPTAPLNNFKQYLRLYFDANNYIEVGYTYITATGYATSTIKYNGTSTTTTSTLSGTITTEAILRVRIIFEHGKATTYYKDGDAWTPIAAYFYSAWKEQGWTVRLGQINSNAGGYYFANLRVQAFSAFGLESVTPDATDCENTNLLLTCYLRSWQPGIYDPEARMDMQPPWTVETQRAQQTAQLRGGSIIHVDNTTKKCYTWNVNDIMDDMDFIPCVLHSKEIATIKTPSGDIGGSQNKFCTWGKMIGSWGLPFRIMQVASPNMVNDEKTVQGYGNGTAMDSTQMQANALANTEDVWYKVKFNKMLGLSHSFQIRKMDTDATFEFQQFDTEINIARSRV